MANEAPPAANPTPPARGRIARGTEVVERAAEDVGDFLWRRIQRRPYLGVALAGGAGLALASFVGVAELAVGVVAGYAAYKILKQHEPPSRALREALEVGKEVDV